MTRDEMLLCLEAVARDYESARQESPRCCAADLRGIKRELRIAWRKNNALVKVILFLAERLE